MLQVLERPRGEDPPTPFAQCAARTPRPCVDGWHRPLRWKKHREATFPSPQPCSSSLRSSPSSCIRRRSEPFRSQSPPNRDHSCALLIPVFTCVAATSEDLTMPVATQHVVRLGK